MSRLKHLCTRYIEGIHTPLQLCVGQWNIQEITVTKQQSSVCVHDLKQKFIMGNLCPHNQTKYF